MNKTSWFPCARSVSKYLLSFRDQNNDLQERSERITKKAESLAAEIREVKEQLAETKAGNMAGKRSLERIQKLHLKYIM